MTGATLKSSLMPLINPSAAAATAARFPSSTPPLTREAARLAVRAIKLNGGFFEPQPTQSTGPHIPSEAHSAGIILPETLAIDEEEDLELLGEMEDIAEEEEEEEEEEQPMINRRMTLGPRHRATLRLRSRS